MSVISSKRIEGQQNIRGVRKPINIIKNTKVFRFDVRSVKKSKIKKNTQNVRWPPLKWDANDHNKGFIFTEENENLKINDYVKFDPYN